MMTVDTVAPFCEGAASFWVKGRCGLPNWGIAGILELGVAGILELGVAGILAAQAGHRACSRDKRSNSDQG